MMISHKLVPMMTGPRVGTEDEVRKNETPTTRSRAAASTRFSDTFITEIGLLISILPTVKLKITKRRGQRPRNVGFGWVINHASIRLIRLLYRLEAAAESSAPPRDDPSTDKDGRYWNLSETRLIWTLPLFNFLPNNNQTTSIFIGFRVKFSFGSLSVSNNEGLARARPHYDCCCDYYDVSRCFLSGFYTARRENRNTRTSYLPITCLLLS